MPNAVVSLFPPHAAPYLRQLTQCLPQVMRLLNLDPDRQSLPSHAPSDALTPENFQYDLQKRESLCGKDLKDNSGDPAPLGTITVGEYAARLRTEAPWGTENTSRSSKDARPFGISDGADLLALALEHTRRLLGQDAAKALEISLEKNFGALTANHHGVDFHPEFAQGSLMYALGDWEAPAVPVFAVGGVPMNNPAFPRGIILGEGIQGNLTQGDGNQEGRQPGNTDPTAAPAKAPRLPIFPVSTQRTMVSFHPPVTHDMLKRAAQSPLLKALPTAQRRILLSLLDTLYGAPDVLAQCCFRDQATIMNSRLWDACFKAKTRHPKLISLDIQFLSGSLIQHDLLHPTSLCHAILLEPEMTKALYHELNGERACWSLAQKTQENAPQTHARVERGTFLFWAIDELGRPLPMSLSADGHTLLTEKRSDLNVHLTAKDLIPALQEQRLLPGLFLTFSITALERALRCCGGVYQLDYIPAMAAGIRRAFHACGEHAQADNMAHACSPLCTGFLPLRAHPDSPWNLPPNVLMTDCCPPKSSALRAPHYAAGPLEYIGCGGLDESHLDALRALPLREAFAAALPYHYADLIPQKERREGWGTALAGAYGVPLLA